MRPIYVRKGNPSDRVTWMDRFIATEPQGGVREVVERAWHGRAKSIFIAILAVESDAGRAAA